MIDRELLPYYQNILNFNNKNTNLDDLYELLTFLKNKNNIDFLNKVLHMSNDNIDLEYFNNVLDAIKFNKDLEYDILDSFSDNQIASKTALLNAIDNLNILNKESTVIIWGGWYGSILIPKLKNRVKKIVNIDLDKDVLRIAKNKLFPNVKNIDYICDDVFANCKKVYLDTNLIINTSCEHMRPMKEWPWFGPGALKKDNIPGKDPKISSNCYFAFQSNNMFGIEGHINCVNSIDEFKEQLPERAEVLYQEEVEDTRGTRYMLIGKILHL